MKTLQKTIGEIYRFRCHRCESKFEMSGEEKVENDWEQLKKRDAKAYDRDKKNGWEPITSHDFYCPVCERESYSRRKDWHCYAVFDDGTEYLKY